MFSSFIYVDNDRWYILRLVHDIIETRTMQKLVQVCNYLLSGILDLLSEANGMLSLLG